MPILYYNQIIVTTPAATLLSAPLITQVNLGDIMLHTVKVRIPSGHAGQTGMQINLSGEPIIPWGRPPQFINGDNDNLLYDYEDEVTNGLTISTYNLGRYPHRHYFTFINTPISKVLAVHPTVKIQAIS